MNLQQLLVILKLRWWLIAAAMVLATLAASLITWRLPKVYTSQTSLLLDVKADPLVATFMPAIATPAYLATQSHIIRSDRVASLVAQKLGLSKDKEAVGRWYSETKGAIPLETYFANMMQRGLTVESIPGTNVLQISFTSSDAGFASVVANTYAQAYIDFGVDLRTDPAKQYAGFFEKRLKELRSELDAAKNSLVTAQQNVGVTSSDSRMDEEINKLTALQSQLASAIAERTELSIRARNSGAETSPDVQQSATIASLKGQIARLETEFGEAAAKYGTGHPQYQNLERQLATTRNQLATEMRRVSGTSQVLTQASEQKVAELRAQIEAQKRRVFELRGSKDDLDMLARDVEVAQRAYDAVAQRKAQVTLESQSDLAGARVLSRAVPALAPSQPSMLKNTLGGLAGGIGLGVALALGLEFLNRRVRSASDLQSIEGVPLLAVLPLAPRDKRQGGGMLPGLAAASHRLLPHRKD
jgi:chain length determinant protein EpsF